MTEAVGWSGAPMADRRLLILGGTGDAIALAARAAELPGLSVVSSLAGRTRNPRAPEGELRVGGFGGPDGLARYLRDDEIDLVIDATHPFAARITVNAVEACEGTARPLLALRRPEWRREAGDRWVEVDSVADAAEAARYELHGTAYLVTARGFDQWELYLSLRPAGQAWTIWRADAAVRMLRQPRPGEPEIILP